MKVIATLLLLSLPALADEAQDQQKQKLRAACPSIEQLHEQAQECDDNGQIGQAGINCYQAFQNAIKMNSAATQLAMLATNAGSQNGQSQKYANSAADLATSEASLADLIAAGHQTHNNLDGYLHEGLYFPEDYDMEDGPFQQMFGSADQFLDSQACFYENEQGIKGLLKRLDDDLAQLEKTKSAVHAMRGTSTGRESNTASLNKAAHGVSKGRTPSSVPAGKSTNGSSTITGKIPANEEKY